MYSVIKLPLKTEKWQEDLINKRLRLSCDVYNAMRNGLSKRYEKMTSDKDYIEAMDVINKLYTIKDAKEKSKYKKSDEYKNAYNITKEIRKEYDFAGPRYFYNLVPQYIKIYKQNISTVAARMSIADPLWQAWEKYMFKEGRRVSFRKYRDFNTLKTDGKSYLRIVDKDNNKVLNGTDENRLYLMFGTQGNKVAKIPIKIDKKSEYIKEMLLKPIKIVQLKREIVRGKYKYLVYITVEGCPATKRNKEGDEKHPIGKGKIAMYINPPTLTVYNGKDFTEFNLSDNVLNFATNKELVLQYMENSRRISNPENFNADGTIKKGKRKEGNTKLDWNFSRNYYKKGKDILHEFYRKENVSRNLKNNILANQIIAMGSEIIVNDYPFAKAQERSKKDELTKKGTPKSKKRAGKTILNNAPATLCTLINQKLESRGYDEIKKVKLQNVDKKKKDYKKYYAKKMYDEN